MAGDRLAAGAARLHSRLSARAGAVAAYNRGGTTLAVAVVVVGDEVGVTSPTQPPLRANVREREFVLAVAVLRDAGLFPPQPGDTLTVGGAVYTAAPRPEFGQAVWAWGEADRVTVRVRTSQRGAA